MTNPKSRGIWYLSAPDVMARLLRFVAVTLLLLGTFSGVTAEEEKAAFGSSEWVSDGLEGQIYYLPEDTGQLPDFRKLTPIGKIYTKKLDVSERNWQEGFPGISDRNVWFAIVYTSSFTVSTPGRYTFRLVSDDGSRLYIDGKLVVDNDGLHSATSAEGAIDLDGSRHHVVVQYFQGPPTEVALQLFSRLDNGPEEVFPGPKFQLSTPPLDRQFWPYLLAALAAVFIVTTGIARRSRRAVVRIESPQDLLICASGRDVTFEAATHPLRRSADVKWEVPMDQSQSATSGSGSHFTTRWTETGVKQVIARLDDSADDVLVYVFKTSTGDLTLASILNASPPAVKRKATDYHWYRKHDLPRDETETPAIEG